MRTILSAILPALLAVTLSGCSYQGNEQWRRSVCESIVDELERARCVEDAMRPENEYRHDVEQALEP